LRPACLCVPVCPREHISETACPILRSLHGMRSRVYATVRCPSVRPVDRQQQRCAAGLLLSAGSRCRSTVIGTQRRRSAANAGCVVSRAEERGSTQACLCMRLCRLVTGTGHNYRIARCHLPQSTDHTYATVDDFQASSLQFTRTARNSVLLGARRCRSTSPACTHGAQQQTRRTTGQTDGRTLERFTDSASHTMRTV